MICVSIQETNLQKCREILKTCAMAEIRADLCKFSTKEIEQIITGHPNILITCRIANSSKEYASEQITHSIIRGAKYVDIELEAPDTYLEYIKSYAKANNCKLIISYHNFKETNSIEELIKIYDLCLRKGADIVKIVTTAHNISDAVRTLSLYKTDKYLTHNNGSLVAFAMGEAGKFTRYLCLALGAPYTYIAYNKESATAPGQYTKAEIEQLLEPANYTHIFTANTNTQPLTAPTFICSTNRLDTSLNNCTKISIPHSLTIPCSKSVAQRAILAAALACGESNLDNYAPCNDITGAIEVIKNLGCKVTIRANTLKIKGGKPKNITNLSIGESGLFTRLLIPFAAYLSQLNGKEIEITGHGSLLKRNLLESAKALEAAGAKCTTNGYLPFKIFGSISNSAIKFSGKESSQIVSGFLITLPLLGHNSTLTITNPTSIPYIRLTIKTLEQFGIKIETQNKLPDSIIYNIIGNQIYSPANIYLDSDWSSAAYFAVAGAIAGEITLLNMPLNSAQADEAILEILKQCGAEIIIKSAKNNLVNITVKTNILNAFSYNATNCPDLFPILAILATHCNGTSCIKGVTRLLQKESNRAETIYTEFTLLGANINIIDDNMYISGSKLHGGMVRSHNDHRIAMSIIIATLFIKEPVILNDVKCIDKSFPSFIEKLTGIAK